MNMFVDKFDLDSSDDEQFFSQSRV